MKKMAPLIALLFLFCSSIVQAQQYSDQSEWESLMCGTVVSEDFEGFTFDAGVSTADTPFATEWGKMEVQEFYGDLWTFNDESGQGIIATEFGGGGENPRVAFDGLAPELEGLGFIYEGDGFNLVITEGVSIVDMIDVPAAATPTFFGWRNTTVQTRVSHVSFQPHDTTTGVEQIKLHSIDLSFGVYCEQDLPPRDQLGSIIDVLEGLVPTGSSTVDEIIECGVFNLQRGERDRFWDAEGRLTRKGHQFLRRLAKATRCLMDINGNEVVDQVVANLQALSHELTEYEIDAAVERGGDQAMIDQANNYLVLAIQNESSGDFADAIEMRRLAWIYARGA